jgi:putative methyltransferase (TIGR04325 family)
MNNFLKSIAKETVPPVLLKTYRRLSKNAATEYGWSGNYSSWEEAQRLTTGYNADVILERVKLSLLKVKSGQAVYERDSVLFDQIQLPFPLLTALLTVAIEHQSQLNILDFGGSLGSTYFQCRNVLSGLKQLSWNIVEQKQFVDCGKRLLEDKHLKFFYDIETCVSAKKPDVILLSGVIQCLEKPYEWLEKIVHYDFKFIILDRTGFVMSGGDRLTIQKVPPEIYPASYPCWFFNLEKFLAVFSERYELIFDFDALDKANIPSQYKGFYFRRKTV